MLQCFCQSECACLHKTVNTVVFFVKSYENTNLPKMESTLANVQNCPNNEKRKLVIYKFETFVWIWFSTCLIRAANWCGKISMIVEFVKRMPDEVFLFWFSWSTSCLLTLFILFVDQSKYTLIFIYRKVADYFVGDSWLYQMRWYDMWCFLVSIFVGSSICWEFIYLQK